MWSFTRGSNCKALTGKILVFCIGGRFLCQYLWKAVIILFYSVINWMCVNQEITHTWKIKSYIPLSIRCFPLLECTWQPLMRKQSHCQICWIHTNYPPSPMPFSATAENKVDVTRDDSQRRFLAQHSLTTLLFHCLKWLQYCSNIWTLFCVKNCRCESSRVTSP